MGLMATFFALEVTPIREDPWRYAGPSLDYRLRRLEETLSSLATFEGLGPTEWEGEGPYCLAPAYGLLVAVHHLLYTGYHLLKAKIGIVPRGYDEVVEQLAKASVISKDLASRLSTIAELREQLVHPYPPPDSNWIVAALETVPRDLADFAREIRDWLGERPS